MRPSRSSKRPAGSRKLAIWLTALVVVVHITVYLGAGLAPAKRTAGLVLSTGRFRYL
jgi:hypothetical protein